MDREELFGDSDPDESAQYINTVQIYDTERPSENKGVAAKAEGQQRKKSRKSYNTGKRAKSPNRII